MSSLRSALACLLIFGLVTGAAAQEPPPPAQDDAARVQLLARSAALHYDLHEYRDALAQYSEAYQLRPDPVFLFYIGECSRKLGDPAAAAAAYRSLRGEVDKLLLTVDAAVEAGRVGSGAVTTTDSEKATAKSRNTLAYVAIAVVVVVLAGAGLGVGLGLGLRPSPPSSTLGTTVIRF